MYIARPTHVTVIMAEYIEGAVLQYDPHKWVVKTGEVS